MSVVAGVGSFSVSPTTPVAPLGGGAPAVPGAGDAFAGVLDGMAPAGMPGGGLSPAVVGRLSDLQRLQGSVDDLAVKAVTGQLQDPSQYTIAATEATLATQMTVTLRNKAVEAYSDIMRMQL